jgi:hypothetical protein
VTTSGGVPRDAPTTVVRFRDVTQQPDYAVLHKYADAQKHKLPHSPDDFILSHAGQPVAICLPPVEPAWHWRCGVERVWQVPDGEVARLTGSPPPYSHVYVCEHQVEID